MYCAEPGSSSPTGMCNAGYICTAKSTTPVPSDGVMGSVCPAGGYCEIGSWTSIACKAGYYNDREGAETYFDCSQCRPGYYCDGQVSTEMTGECDAGYYCLAGSPVSNQYPAEPGYYTE